MKWDEAIEKAVLVVCTKYLKAEITEHEFTFTYFPLSGGKEIIK